MSSVKDGKLKGLDGRFVANFFRAQIEANKLVQYSLLAQWHRTASAPPHAPINLDSAIRPELDKLQSELIGELAETTAIRASPECPVYIAKAVSKYLQAHKRDSGTFQAMALDRALAAACTSFD